MRASDAEPPRAAFLFIYITVFIDMLAVGIVVPVLPQLIVDFSGGDLERGAKLTGLFAGITAAIQMLIAPLLGVLSDRFGRRPVLLASLLGLGLDYFVMAGAPSLTWLLLGRVVSGITAATFPTAVAYVADITPPEKRASRYGALGSAFGFGFIAGPALGGLLGSIDLSLPFWVAGTLCLANVAYGVLVLPESLAAVHRRPFAWARAHPLRSLSLLRQTKTRSRLTVVSLLSGFAHESLPNLIVLYLATRYGWGGTAVGLTVTAIGAGAAIVSLGLVRRIIAALGERRALVFGFSCGAAGFLVYALATDGRWFLLGVPLMALWSVGTAALQALLTNDVPPEAQGELQGSLTVLRGLTGIAGPLFFSQIFAQTVGPSAPVNFPGACFLLAALAVTVGALVGTRVARN